VTTIVTLDGVSRRYGDKLALTDISMRVEEGTIHCLLGPNGAGKTTLLRVMAGLVGPSEGSVSVLGGDPFQHAIRSRIGWVPSDDRSFYMRVSGRENLLFFARLYGRGKRESIRLVDSLLEEVGLTDDAHKPVHGYSHGMTKRLAVARGLLGESPLLLVDEATHDLDIEGSRSIRALFRGLAERGSTIVWSTHRLEELPGLVDTVTVLDRGAVRFDGSLADLVASVDRPVYRVAVRHEEGAADSAELAAAALGKTASVVGGDGHLLSVRLAATSELGAALRRLMDGGFEVLTCHEESGAIERAVEMRLGS